MVATIKNFLLYEVKNLNIEKFEQDLPENLQFS